MRFMIMILSAAAMAWIPNAADRAAFAESPAPDGHPEIVCGKPGPAWNARIPPDLYGGMVKCIEGNDYDSAVFYFAVAGTYIYYDSLRVTDETARSAQTALLQKAVANLDRTKRDSLMDAIQRHLGNADLLPEICTEVARVGVPQYVPRYIIRRGMNAEAGKFSEEDLVKGFDKINGWKNAMNGYLHCPSFGK